MRVFPTRLFYFDKQEADLDRRTVSGGTALSGEEDVIVTDGGGRVFLEFGDADLDDPEIANAWRAIATLGDGGASAIIVSLGDAKHQQLGDIETPIGGLPWWNESDFVYDTPHATLSEAAALRATTLQIDVSHLIGAVRPGMWLSIDHATWRHRAYRVGDVTSDGASATVTIRPPLREATASGTAVEFYDPKVTARIDGDMRSPMTGGYAEGSVRFVEYPGVPA